MLRQTCPLCPIEKGNFWNDEECLNFYCNQVADLKPLGYEIKSYDPCVANKMINGQLMTICWHVDDLLIGHANPKVVTHLLEWLATRYNTAD
jgi:hypothetical protein